jgi:hypothetical protein
MGRSLVLQRHYRQGLQGSITANETSEFNSLQCNCSYRTAKTRAGGDYILIWTCRVLLGAPVNAWMADRTTGCLRSDLSSCAGWKTCLYCSRRWNADGPAETPVLRESVQAVSLHTPGAGNCYLQMLTTEVKCRTRNLSQDPLDAPQKATYTATTKPLKIPRTKKDWCLKTPEAEKQACLRAVFP